MSNEQMMTKDQFIKRLTNLCLRSGLAVFPKDGIDQHILLKSAVLLIGNTGQLTEKEINEKLQLWTLQVCQIKNFDWVTLRRALVDAGYITRSSDGTRYQVAQPGPQPQRFDASIDQLEIVSVIEHAREEIERRKQAYLEKSKGT